MKCPYCKKSVSWENIIQSEPRVIYECPKCNNPSTPKFNYFTVLFFSLVLAVAVEFIFSLVIATFSGNSNFFIFINEAILSWSIATIFGIVLYLKLNKLIPEK